MGRISRWFQHKDEKPSKVEETPPTQKGVSPDKKASQGGPDQAFGLQFTFDSGETRTFTSLPISIGRGEHNDIVLGDKTVSAEHARVYYDERVRGVCIVDNDSLNGLYINDQPTRRNVLQDGVKIRLGSVNLVFRDTGYIHPGTQ
jgi:pSer/pThr/pTyr-binding forkhead associated (FHA) protein